MSKNIISILFWVPSISKLTWYKHFWCSKFDYKKCTLWMISISIIKLQTVDVKFTKKVWQLPKIITSMKWFKTLFTSMLYEICSCFDFQHKTIKFKLWCWCYCWIPEINDEIIETHIKCPFFFQTSRLKKILYSNVVHVLR